MPRKREEFKEIGQAERERAIIDVVQKNGIVSIDEVVEALISRFELDLSDDKAKDALTKSVRIYLQKSAENRDLFGRAYFRKGADNSEKIPDEDLERDKAGKVKNKYHIKYFLLGSDDHVPGGSLITKTGGLFLSHTNSSGTFSIEWQISRLFEIKLGHFYFIFRDNADNHLSLSAPTVDAPFSLIIGRHNSANSAPETPELSNKFKRPSLLLLEESTVSGPIKNKRPGHCAICVKSDGSIILEDFNSTNGTSFTKADHSQIDRALKLSCETKVASTALKHDFIPESYKGSWTNVADQAHIDFPAFIRLGSFEAFIFVT